jgi:hypothetical protein
MMNEIKMVLSDIISTLFFFAYEALVLAFRIGRLFVDSVYTFLFEYTIPFILDLLADASQFAHHVHFELLSMLSLLFLRLSQAFASLSQALLEQAEEKFSKRIWF